MNKLRAITNSLILQMLMFSARCKGYAAVSQDELDSIRKSYDGQSIGIWGRIYDTPQEILDGKATVENITQEISLSLVSLKHLNDKKVHIRLAKSLANSTGVEYDPNKNTINRKIYELGDIKNIYENLNKLVKICGKKKKLTGLVTFLKTEASKYSALYEKNSKALGTLNENKKIYMPSHMVA